MEKLSTLILDNFSTPSISTANSINQYSKLTSSFFYKKKEDEMVLTRKEKETLRTLSQDTSIIICKPDK